MAPENGVSRDKNNDRILNYKAVLSTLQSCTKFSTFRGDRHWVHR